MGLLCIAMIMAVGGLLRAHTYSLHLQIVITSKKLFCYGPPLTIDRSTHMDTLSPPADYTLSLLPKIPKNAKWVLQNDSSV